MLVTPADFSPFCITAPSDSRLPGGGGYQVCGLYDVSPAQVRPGQQRRSSRTRTSGRSARVNDFFNVTVDARLKADLLLGGGVDTGRSVNDACFDVDSPGAVATSLPGNLASGGAGVLSTPTPFTKHDHRRQEHLPHRHAVRGADAVQGIPDRIHCRGT